MFGVLPCYFKLDLGLIYCFLIKTNLSDYCLKFFLLSFQLKDIGGISVPEAAQRHFAINWIQFVAGFFVLVMNRTGICLWTEFKSQSTSMKHFTAINRFHNICQWKFSFLIGNAESAISAFWTLQVAFFAEALQNFGDKKLRWIDLLGDFFNIHHMSVFWLLGDIDHCS